MLFYCSAMKSGVSRWLIWSEPILELAGSSLRRSHRKADQRCGCCRGAQLFECGRSRISRFFCPLHPDQQPRNAILYQRLSFAPFRKQHVSVQAWAEQELSFQQWPSDLDPAFDISEPHLQCCCKSHKSRTVALANFSYLSSISFIFGAGSSHTP